jgi:hypothetical protein
VGCGELAESIPRDNRLLRRFIDDENHITWEGDRPIPHPLMGNSMQFDPELSTFWREHIEDDGNRIDSVLGRCPEYTLVGEIGVGAALDVPMAVAHDPTDEVPIIGCAHAGVGWSPSTIPAGSHQPTRPEKKRLRAELARGFSFVVGDVHTERPPGN